MLITSIVGIVLIALSAAAQDDSWDGTYDFDVSSDGLLPPARRDAYGPGLDSDATGRPFYWAPKNEKRAIPDPTLDVKPDAYGPGIGSDQYGRPVERRAWP